MYTDLIYTIYKLNQEHKLPTKELLISLGITEDKILGALEEQIIIEKGSNSYSLVPVKQLYQYGLMNLEIGNKKTAQDVFELCYKIKPKHRETCLQLLYNAINKGNYDLAYRFLYELEHISTNEHLRKDYKIYLYLLSKVSAVPAIYQESLSAIAANNNLLIHNKPKGHQKQENYLMQLILKEKYKYAFEKINDFLGEDYEYTVHRVIIKSLLREIIKLNDQIKKDLHEQVKKRNYRGIVTSLEEKSLTHRLGIDEQSMLMITQQIINIIETQSTPVPIENDANQVFEAIKYYDYDKALLLERAFLESKDIPLERSSIYLLLEQITKLIFNLNRLENNSEIKSQI